MSALGGLLDGHARARQRRRRVVRRAARRARRRRRARSTGARPPTATTRSACASRGSIADPRIEAPTRRRSSGCSRSRPHWVDVARAGDVLPALDERAPAAARRAADRLRGHVRADARRRRRRRAARGLGATRPRRPSGMAAAGEIAFDALPPPRRRRADGRDHLGLDAADRRRGPGDRGARVLEPQRGRRALPALRRARRRRDGPPAVDERAPRAEPARRAARRSTSRSTSSRSPRRRCRWATSATAATSPSSALLTRALAPALARHVDLGGVEALDFLRTNDYWFLNFSMVASKLRHDGRARRRGLDGRDDVRAQRRERRHPRERTRRRVVHGAGGRRSTASTSPATARRTPTPTSATARSPRPTASAASRSRRRPAIVGFVGGTTGRGDPRERGHGDDHGRPPPRVPAARARLRRQPGRHRRAQGGRHAASSR